MRTRRYLRRIAFAAVIAALLATPRPAQGATITYTDVESFSAATTGITTIDFEAQNTSGGFTYWLGAGLNIGGVQPSAPSSAYLWVVDENVAAAYQWGSGASLLFGPTNESDGDVVIQFGTGVFAFGFDLIAEPTMHRTRPGLGLQHSHRR